MPRSLNHVEIELLYLPGQAIISRPGEFCKKAIAFKEYNILGFNIRYVTNLNNTIMHLEEVRHKQEVSIATIPVMFTDIFDLEGKTIYLLGVCFYEKEVKYFDIYRNFYPIDYFNNAFNLTENAKNEKEQVF